MRTRSSASPPTARPCTRPGGACAMVRALLAGEADRFLRRAPSGHHADGRAGDGLLPVQQRRDRGRAGGPRAGRKQGADHRLGRPPRQRDRRDLPQPPGRRCSRASTSRAVPPAPARSATPARGEGLGYTINIAVPSGSDEEVWLSVLEHVIVPVGARVRTRADPDLRRVRRPSRLIRSATACSTRSPSRRWPARTRPRGGDRRRAGRRGARRRL